ncbi:type 1 glutamine amidotransferase [Piscinibacter sakaiensis]|uniref:type 1 glutamine amidotransferase n=1 Tax=Piscinibacter sakaiensis TaxID=1547922 RepID=UPI003AAF5C3C
MNQQQKPVLVLQHLPDDGPAYLATWLAQQRETMDLRDHGDAYPRDLSGHSALAVLGGEMSANDDLPALRRGEALILDAMDRGVPVIGHCLGGQLMARALGARVGASRWPEIGWHRLDWAEQSGDWFGDAAQSDPEIFQWHGEAFELPHGAVWLAGNAACRNQAFAIGPHLAMQFHIELDLAKLKVWTTGHDPARHLRDGMPDAQIQSTVAIHERAAARLAAQQRVAATIYARWLGNRR